MLLANTVAEMKRRMGTLYKILEAEKQMNTIIFGSAQIGNTGASRSDASATLPPAAEVREHPLSRLISGAGRWIPYCRPLQVTAAN